ncbi:MAG: RNase adapter RapZ [Thermodesulfovibrionales bacterium]|nr:RNase adapter RapZ [Thermodesulfovibrionales bacterium]
MNVVIISGLSGAGKTVALRALEDSGYFCIDNLPITLIEPFLLTIKATENIKKVGIGVDVREKEFLSDAYQILSALKGRYATEILFFEAEKDILARRFKETRRPHPVLSASNKMNIDYAIEEEKRLLSVIKDASDRIIDTSTYTPHQLRHMMMSVYGDSAAVEGFNISLISFGYKFGAPLNADLLFDVRFLPNPYFIPELKPLKGTDAVVSDFVLSSADASDFISHLNSFLDFLIPGYIKEGRTYLVIGIGCTGGVHRSPAIVEEIAKNIKQRHGIRLNVIHRDVQ